MARQEHMRMSAGGPAVFLDRDGTVIEEVEYLSDLAEIRPYAGVGDALRRLRTAGFRVVLVTNQSGVARGYFTESFVNRSHERLEDLLDFRFDGIYYCPHGPDAGCRCRKPGTGLIERAVAELGIDARCSYMVGDKPADIGLADNAGLTAVLVRTGYGASCSGELRGIRVCDNLVEACDWIIRDTRPENR